MDLGCKGCESIAGSYKAGVAHSEGCRLRVINETKSNPVTAARVKAARGREDKWLAKTLEEEKEKEKKARGAAPEVEEVVGRTPHKLEDRPPLDSRLVDRPALDQHRRRRWRLCRKGPR